MKMKTKLYFLIKSIVEIFVKKYHNNMYFIVYNIHFMLFLHSNLLK